MTESSVNAATERAYLVVEADGPLSVRCESCGLHVAGTEYPDTSFPVQQLRSLAHIHAPRCRPRKSE